jgi:hypothetical protein
MISNQDQKAKSLIKKKERNIIDEDVEEKSPSIKEPNAFSSAQNQINLVTTKKQNKEKNSL